MYISKKRVKLFIIFSFFILLLPSIYPGYVAGDPWSSYKGNERNTGYSAYLTEDITSDIRWTYETEEFIISSPTISSDGTIYVGSFDGYMYAIKPNGVERWRFETEGQIRSSVAIDEEGNIYFGSRDGYIYSLDEAGDLRWRYHDGSRIDSSPIIDGDGNIYIGSGEGFLYSFTSDGEINWEFKVDDEISTSPALNYRDEIIFGSEDGSVYSISSEGDLNWDFETDGYIRSSPSIDDDGNIYFGSGDGNMYSLEPDGTKRWNYTTGSWISSSPSIDSEGNIYFGSTDNIFYSLDNEGELRWEYSSTEMWRGSPVIGSDDVIYIGGTDGIFYAFYPEGIVKWSITLGSDIFSTPSISPDGVLYIGTRNGNLYSIGESDKIPTEPTGIKVDRIEDGITISWEKPSYKGVSNGLEYKIYRGPSPENLTYLATTEDLEYEDTEVEDEGHYYYKITAINKHGESTPSEIVDIDLSEDVGHYTLTELDFNTLILISIVLSIITVTGLRMNLKRKQEFEENSMVNNDPHENGYITCPHCGKRTIIDNGNDSYRTCERCKSKI